MRPHATHVRRARAARVRSAPLARLAGHRARALYPAALRIGSVRQSGERRRRVARRDRHAHRTPADAPAQEAELREIELRKAVRRIKDKSPHLTAKEVHLELVDDGFGKDSGGVTIGEVKRACSKVTKERRLSDASQA